MFNSITWGQYFSAMALILICYYIIVGYRYFRWEILSLVGIKKIEDHPVIAKPVPKNSKPGKVDNYEDYLPKTVSAIDISTLEQSFRDEVLAFLKQAANEIEVGELLRFLQLIAAKYLALNNADCKDELLIFVLIEANLKYPNLLQPNDVVRLWN